VVKLSCSSLYQLFVNKGKLRFVGYPIAYIYHIKMLPNIFCNLLARTPRMFPVRRLMSTSSNLYLKFLAETTAKAQRRQFLERQILLRAKIVVKADKRQLTDTIV
jgi:hypothetical protein